MVFPFNVALIFTCIAILHAPVSGSKFVFEGQANSLRPNSQAKAVDAGQVELRDTSVTQERAVTSKVSRSRHTELTHKLTKNTKQRLDCGGPQKKFTNRECEVTTSPLPVHEVNLQLYGKLALIVLAFSVFVDLVLSSGFWKFLVAQFRSASSIQHLQRNQLLEQDVENNDSSDQTAEAQHFCGPAAYDLPVFKPIGEWLGGTQSSDRDSRYALLGADPSASSISYASLEKIVHSSKADAAFEAAGIESVQCRVAVAMPSGPQLAACLLTVSARCVACPLDHKFNEREYEAAFQLLGISAVVTDCDSVASIAAKKLGISVIDSGLILCEDQDTASSSSSCILRTSSEDTVLLLFTSGTTGCPKLVPYTWQRLCSTGYYISKSLELSCRDVCLNAMPLFHIGGISCNLLATLNSGGSVICLPDAKISTFVPRLTSMPSPTWYYASPTIHMAVCDTLGAQLPSNMQRHSLRFCRSAAAALPPSLALRLSQCLKCSIVPTYGMSECMPIASVPLSWNELTVPTVGRITGPEIQIVGVDGKVLPAPKGTEESSTKSGEILVRGPLVMPRYSPNATGQEDVNVNADAFSGDWFRTGDLGFLDKDGWLYITGRSKDIINRGGETIAPNSIETAIDDLEGAKMVVAFPVPHPSLGETVGLVVVLEEGFEKSPGKVFEFCESRLASVRRPDVVVFVPEVRLLKTSTGKLQRAKMAADFKLDCDEFPAAFEATESRQDPLRRLDASEVLVPAVDSLGMVRTMSILERCVIPSVMGFCMLCVLTNHLTHHFVPADIGDNLHASWDALASGHHNMCTLFVFLALRDSKTGPSIVTRDVIFVLVLLTWHNLLPATLSSLWEMTTGMSQYYYWEGIVFPPPEAGKFIMLSPWFCACAVYLKLGLLLFHHLPASTYAKGGLYTLGLLLMIRHDFHKKDIHFHVFENTSKHPKMWAYLYFPWYCLSFYYGEAFALWYQRTRQAHKDSWQRVVALAFFFLCLQADRLPRHYIHHHWSPKVVYFLGPVIFHVTFPLQFMLLNIAVGKGVWILQKIGETAFMAFVSQWFYGYIVGTCGISIWGLVSIPSLSSAIRMVPPSRYSNGLGVIIGACYATLYALGIAFPLQLLVISAAQSTQRHWSRLVACQGRSWLRQEAIERLWQKGH
eukprot:TRINITY_DN4687_c0_g1_i2.p1 TRINITY_DN4687_c0_g1~~TRINITY_DN4687_c0_g1_i2.p1  ORF type:complete len:1148 (+),score=150.43 TRINITY_DN4687_c0_g1_i2:60-3503(+)